MYQGNLPVRSLPCISRPCCHCSNLATFSMLAPQNRSLHAACHASVRLSAHWSHLATFSKLAIQMDQEPACRLHWWAVSYVTPSQLAEAGCASGVDALSMQFATLLGLAAIAAALTTSLR